MPKLKCKYCEDQTKNVTFYDDGDGNPICEDCLYLDKAKGGDNNA